MLRCYIRGEYNTSAVCPVHKFNGRYAPFVANYIVLLGCLFLTILACGPNTPFVNRDAQAAFEARRNAKAFAPTSFERPTGTNTVNNNPVTPLPRAYEKVAQTKSVDKASLPAAEDFPSIGETQPLEAILLGGE